MKTDSQNPSPERRNPLPRLVALAAAAYTLVWLAGCGEPLDVTANQNAKKKAAADAQAEWDAKLAEGPTPIVPEDFWRVEPKDKVGAVRGASSQALLRSKNKIDLDFQIRHNLEIRAADDTLGWPKSHEEFLKIVVDEWGMKLPVLKEPYEIWYDAESHEILKRPKPDASKTPVEESPPLNKP